jgi:hypothetical protein
MASIGASTAAAMRDPAPYSQRSLVEMQVILEEFARRRSTTTYTALSQRMTTMEFDMHVPTYRGLLGQMLDAIGKKTEGAGRGILPVLVVKKGTNRPSKGFFRFAQMVGRDVTNPDRLVLDEMAKVFAAYDLA